MKIKLVLILAYLLIILMLAWTAWVEFGWGQEPMYMEDSTVWHMYPDYEWIWRKDEHGRWIRKGEDYHLVRSVHIATEKDIEVFIRTHPNCRIVDRIGSLIKIECFIKEF